MVRADLEGLITPHHKTDFLRVLGLQESDVTSTTFLPLRAFSSETEEFGTPVK